MAQDVMSFVEGQYMSLGMKEGFTNEVKDDIKSGKMTINRPYTHEYDKDVVTVRPELKKSSTSDFYFINKFEMALQKEGSDKQMKQTFQVSSVKFAGEDGNEVSGQNKYTMKEAYNLLSGRPVFKHLYSKDGEYDAWVKLNFNKKLQNGNYAQQQWGQNYGFELKNVLAQYPIKELANDRYAESLVSSLHRGNLQKATFVGEGGKEEQLLVSPVITRGMLNVYDMDKKPIELDQLVEKKYISDELASKLKELFAQKETQEIKGDKQSQEIAGDKSGQTIKGAEQKNTVSGEQKNAGGGEQKQSIGNAIVGFLKGAVSNKHSHKIQ